MKLIISYSPPSIKSIRLSKKRIKQAIQEELSHIAEHFSTHGWKLDKSTIVESLLYDLLGFHVSEALSYEASLIGLHTEFNDEGIFLKSNEPYYPVYYDTYKNKIIIVKNTDDNKYILKYTEDNGYLNLGKL